MKSLLHSLPFIRHHVPSNTPLRKAVSLATKRPVNLKRIEKTILGSGLPVGVDLVEQIQHGVLYLRRERFFKTDAANLLIAGVRAIGTKDKRMALDFGHVFLHEIPDIRLVRTMVAFCRDLRSEADIFAVLKHCKDESYARKTRNEILKFSMKDFADLKGPLPPWTFELSQPLKLSKKGKEFKHKFDPGDLYDNDGVAREYEINGQIEVNEDEKRSAALVYFQFFNDAYRPIETSTVHGLVFSKNVGLYSYLNHEQDGSFSVSFQVPDGAAFVHVGFQTWHATSKVILLPEFEIKPSSLLQFQLEFDKFLSDLQHSKADELVFMFSGTTFVQDVRANRPIRLTRELIARDIPVIFNYHRWRRTDEHPEYKGDLLLQIPIDVTTQFLSRLASIKTDKRKIFIVSYPHPVVPKILNRFKVNGWVNLYDARDDWEEFQKVGQAKWYKKSVEKYIVRNCDHVTAVSWPLAAKLDHYEPIEAVNVVPNALSPHFLSKEYKWKGGQNIKIGYFGHLTDSWFDWDSVIEIAKQRPNYQFELIGHSAPENLNLPPNVDLMGPKTHPEINVIAAEWHVAIIPFKPSLLADAVDPIKIYEYMALDLPTVSFRMPQIDDYPSTITVDNVDDFITALDEYSKHRPKKGALKRWLATNTWGDRTDVMLSLAQRPQNDGIMALGVDE